MLTPENLKKRLNDEIEAYDKGITKEKREAISAELSKIYSDIAFNAKESLSKQLEGLLNRTLEWYKEALENEQHSATLWGVALELGLNAVMQKEASGDSDAQ